jgi:hypothetical protein
MRSFSIRTMSADSLFTMVFFFLSQSTGTVYFPACQLHQLSSTDQGMQGETCLCKIDGQLPARMHGRTICVAGLLIQVPNVFGANIGVWNAVVAGERAMASGALERWVARVCKRPPVQDGLTSAHIRKRLSAAAVCVLPAWCSGDMQTWAYHEAHAAHPVCSSSGSSGRVRCQVGCVTLRSIASCRPCSGKAYPVVAASPQQFNLCSVQSLRR